MKRASFGTALVVSLIAGSAAMAGQGYRGTEHREPLRPAPVVVQPAHDSHGRDSTFRGNDRSHRDDHSGRDNHFRGDDRDHGARHFDGRYGRDNHYRPAPPPPRYVYRPAPPRWGVYHPPRGYYYRTWHRGDRLPAAYYARPYVIGDYRDCGLRAPPRGYHWVRVDRDAVLAAVATGVVLETVFHLF